MALQINISFGVLAPFISTQLDKQGLSAYYDKENILAFEKLKTAINELYLHDIITDAEATKLRNKLMKQITMYLQKQGKKIKVEKTNE